MMLIGLDAASDPDNFGYSIGRYKDGVITIQNAGVLGISTSESVDSVRQPEVAVLRDAIASAESGLIAVDAPLGWPISMVKGLANHSAGASIDEPDKDIFFRRLTDRTLRQRRLGNPLEVGADRIARAAHQALNVLQRLRSIGQHDLPLAWSSDIASWSVIEVYPAATLKACGSPWRKYKHPAARDIRLRIATNGHVAHALPGLSDFVDASEHVFDANLCLLAAADFLGNNAKGPGPEEFESAVSEGWIWCRDLPEEQ